MNSNTTNKTAVIFGATGLVGSHCLRLLLESSYYSKVKVFSRREIEIQHPNLEYYIIDFDKIEEYKDNISGHDIFCTLGTTIKRAGSKAAFIKVDYTYVVGIAKLALINNAQQFILVTAMGSDEDSIFFYNKVKGQVENEVKKLGYNSIRILRPSLLLGERNEKRFAEKLAIHASSFTNLITDVIAPNYSAVRAEQVAKAMIAAAQRPDKGVFIYESNEIRNFK